MEAKVGADRVVARVELAAKRVVALAAIAHTVVL